MSREYTNELLDLVEQGLLDKDAVILACVRYMSEQAVQDMMELNGFNEVEYEDDGQPTELEEWMDFDPDC